VPLIYLIYVMIEPSYEAFSTILVDPYRPELYGTSVTGNFSTSVQLYLETVRNLILTDRVLNEALADKAAKDIPLLRETASADPKVDLRKKLLVTIIPGTYLIRVSYGSSDRHEAFAVVKAVVDSFIRQHRDFMLGYTESLKKQYEYFIKSQKKELDQKKIDLMELAAKADEASGEQPGVKRQQSSRDTVKATFLKEEISDLADKIRVVDRRLDQLAFESSSQLVYVFLQDAASLPRTPTIDNRNRYLAMIPLVTMVTLVGLSLAIEVIRKMDRLLSSWARHRS
jgi:hypothetical protein